MSTIRCYDIDGAIIDELYQWDENVRVVISDIDTTNVSELHFCNRKSEFAIRVSVTKNMSSVSAYIPNALLCQPESIIIFICESLSNSETRTTNVCRIPIHPRPMAKDMDSEDNSTSGDNVGASPPASGGSSSAVYGFVAYDSIQVLSEDQKQIARANIGAVSEADVSRYIEERIPQTTGKCVKVLEVESEDELIGTNLDAYSVGDIVLVVASR